MRRSLVAAIAIIAVLGPGARAGDEAYFTERVEPVLEQRYYECHSHGKKIKGGLTLDSRSGWQQGGDSGPVVVPGKPGESLLMQAVRHTHPDLKMPKEKLPDAEIAALEEWVKRGAPDPRAGAKEAARLTPADWWAVKAPVKPPVPPADADTPCIGVIDSAASLFQVGETVGKWRVSFPALR